MSWKCFSRKNFFFQPCNLENLKGPGKTNISFFFMPRPITHNQFQKKIEPFTFPFEKKKTGESMAQHTSILAQLGVCYLLSNIIIGLKRQKNKIMSRK